MSSTAANVTSCRVALCSEGRVERHCFGKENLSLYLSMADLSSAGSVAGEPSLMKCQPKRKTEHDSWPTDQLEAGFQCGAHVSHLILPESFLSEWFIQDLTGLLYDA